MNLNEALLAAYTSAGAVSKNIDEAEREALIASGAADGMWHTFLVGEGLSGNVNEMLYKYLGDKGYTGTLNERLYAAAVADDLLTWTPEKIHTAYSGDYFISRSGTLFQHSDLIDPADADLDPIGAWVGELGRYTLADNGTFSKPEYFAADGAVRCPTGIRHNMITSQFTEWGVNTPRTVWWLAKESGGASTNSTTFTLARADGFFDARVSGYKTSAAYGEAGFQSSGDPYTIPQSPTAAYRLMAVVAVDGVPSNMKAYMGPVLDTGAVVTGTTSTKNPDIMQLRSGSTLHTTELVLAAGAANTAFSVDDLTKLQAWLIKYFTPRGVSIAEVTP